MPTLDDLEFPPDFFDPPDHRPDAWPDNPELRRAVEWFKSFSLVDLCRAAATVVLAHWLESTGDAPDKVHYLDLGALLKAFEKQQGNTDTNSPSAAGSAIRLLQRFHSRGKPNEQKRYNTRPPTEEDAQLVLGALGFLLREVGWGR